MLTPFQDVKSASEFYEGKIKDLASNISDLEAIVQNKSNTLRAVEEGMDPNMHCRSRGLD